MGVRTHISEKIDNGLSNHFHLNNNNNILKKEYENKVVITRTKSSYDSNMSFTMRRFLGEETNNSVNIISLDEEWNNSHPSNSQSGECDDNGSYNS